MRISNILHSIIGVSMVVFLFSSCFHPDNKISETCFDEILNQDELFVDCGGPNCDECPPACDNGILDYEEGWEEWGIDCGGPCESCCENEVWDTGHPFDPTLDEEWIDCGGLDILCGPCETCSNGVHDPGEETTIGGVLVDAIDCDDDPTTEDCLPCAALCNDGLLNGVEGPCVDCGGACAPCNFDHCENGVLDDDIDDLPDDITQNETEVDCGGCGCPSCDLLCYDGILNGAEEAIDCGGGICVECDDPILCNDGIQNGFETGIDCYDGSASDESACDPCVALCGDLIFNGNELDLDCAGDCPPCAVEGQNFLTYTVTTNNSEAAFEEINQPYESVNTSIGIISFTPGVAADMDDEDLLVFTGGVSHNLTFTIQDIDQVDQNWSAGPDDFTFNFDVVPLMLPDNIVLVANDGFTYESRFNADGIVFSDFDFSYIAAIPPATDPTVELTGSFSGTLSNTDGHTATITNGEFAIIFE